MIAKLQRRGIVVLLCLLVVVVALLVPIREAGERQASYTTNAGEVTSDVLVGQTFQASRDKLSGVAVMFATYSGRENTGTVEFHLRQSIDDTQDLRSATVEPAQLGDNQLYRFEFEPVPDSAEQTYFFFVTAPQTEKGRAVTVDLDGRDPYHLGSAYLVRGQEGPITAETLSRAGKPTVDVGFEAYYSVPLPVALAHKAGGAVRSLRQLWHEDPKVIQTFARAAAMALAALVGVAVVVWRRHLPQRTFLTLFFGLAVLTRLMYAQELPLTNDEGNYLYDARTLLQGRLAGGDGYVKAPLVVAWIALWSLFDQSVLLGRLSSIVISALTLFPLYVLTRELAGKRAGLAAAVLWALTGVTTVFGIYVHTQPLAIFFGIAGLAVLAVALRKPLVSQSATKLFIAAGVLLGLGVISRKSILALGLVPLALVVVESIDWRIAIRRLLLIGMGFAAVVGALFLAAWGVYEVEGLWEALGANSAEDGITAVDPAEVEEVRAYSIRGMTPFFRESLPLILLAAVGFGVLLEGLLWRVLSARSSALPVAKLVWLLPLAVFWWAWSFFLEYEGESVMLLGMRELWYVMGIALVAAALLSARRAAPLHVRHALSIALVGPLWVGGLVFFYMNWIKFHVNYVGEFLPPLVLLSGITLPALWDRIVSLRLNVVQLLTGAAFTAVLAWALFVTNFITFTHAHTGTFELGALNEAAAWAQDNIPANEPIFTGAAAVPYLSGHQVSLDIAHPRWYAYEFTRKDVGRLNTFLPPAEEMVQAFHDANWFLMDQQTAFSFLQEYSDIERGLEEDFVSVKGISNGSNTLTFYQRVK